MSNKIAENLITPGGRITRAIKSLSSQIFSSKTSSFRKIENSNKRKAFSVAEAMIALLIGSIALGMAAPMITKQIKFQNMTDTQFRVLKERITQLERELEANFENEDAQNEANTIPQGVIAMWSGSIANIPGDWALCNGQNGTPDLRNRFIVGAGSSYAVGNTGGEKEVVLTTEQMPKHKHLMWFNGNNVNNPWGYVKNTYGKLSDRGVSTTDWTLNYNQPVGEDKPHENRPPYYALAYIMKIR